MKVYELMESANGVDIKRVYKKGEETVLDFEFSEPIIRKLAEILDDAKKATNYVGTSASGEPATYAVEFSELKYHGASFTILVRQDDYMKNNHYETRGDCNVAIKDEHSSDWPYVIYTFKSKDLIQNRATCLEGIKSKFDKYMKDEKIIEKASKRSKNDRLLKSLDEHDRLAIAEGIYRITPKQFPFTAPVLAKRIDQMHYDGFIEVSEHKVPKGFENGEYCHYYHVLIQNPKDKEYDGSIDKLDMWAYRMYVKREANQPDGKLLCWLIDGKPYMTGKEAKKLPRMPDFDDDD